MSPWILIIEYSLESYWTIVSNGSSIRFIDLILSNFSGDFTMNSKKISPKKMQRAMNVEDSA